MGETTQIDDLIVLGRAAPEPIRDGRETVCLGGYSPTKGWIRIYPTQKRMSDSLRRWNIVSVPVENDPSHDSRDESYKIVGSKEDWDVLHEKVDKVGRLDKPERMQLVHELAGDCPAELNNNHQSLGLVDPAQIIKTDLKPTNRNGVQVDLMENKLKGKNDYKYKLYIKYRCKNCIQKNPHDQQTIEWGVHRYWDEHDDFDGVVDALELQNSDWKKYFFVGNLNNQRTAYIIISIIRFKKMEMVRAGFSDVDNEQATFNSYD